MVNQIGDRSYFKGRKAFVTGGAGFVGANLTKALVESGSDVIVLERDRNMPNTLDVFGLRDKVTVVNGSVDDLHLMERVMNEYEPDDVHHLAAQALVSPANRSPLSTFEANIRGTYILLEACRRAVSVPAVIVASSDKAYGSHETLPYEEDLPLNGTFPYDVSKSCADLLARSYARTYQMRVCVTRSANIYGPGDMNLSRIVPGTIVSVLKNERPIIRSDGTPLREFIHVDDVVDGYLTLSRNIDEVGGEVFNFGSDAPVQIRELVDHIIRESGKDGEIEPDVLLSTKIEREIDAQYLSGAKIAQRLCWKPAIGLKEGIAKTIGWYRDNLNVLST
ncbi:MAG: NAD-dependent epimerase/dehydratase family protein [Pyrinomonadaceae bacterium]